MRRQIKAKGRIHPPQERMSITFWKKGVIFTNIPLGIHPGFSIIFILGEEF
jgi:hypothetical protein